MAGTAQDIGERQADLDEVKSRLKDLKKALSATEGTRSAAAEALAEAEQAFSAATRKLRELAQARQQAEGELQALEAQQRALDARIAKGQAELAAWLRHYYTHGQGERLARLFDAGKPNQIARNAYYMERAGVAHRQMVEGLRQDLQDKTRIGEDLRARREALAQLEGDQRREQENLSSLQADRKAALAQVSAQLNSQRQAVAELQRDEERLRQLLVGLQRIAREQAAKAAARAAAEAQAQRRAAEAAARQASPGAGVRPQARNEPREEVVGRAETLATPAASGGSGGAVFAALQGRLPAPVRGDVIGRFGMPRAGGGATWKGVFIRAAAGAEVHAVAAGEVVFSDWLRGFGNLIIVDHGGDFLSIYGNNDALLRTNGQRVVAGEALASVGASGGGGESGLYFEIRRQGQALDPLKWIRLQ